MKTLKLAAGSFRPNLLATGAAVLVALGATTGSVLGPPPGAAAAEVPGSAYAQAPYGPDYASPAAEGGYGPPSAAANPTAGPAPGLGTPQAYGEPQSYGAPQAYGPPGGGRGVTREQFIERHVRRATAKGRDPERAAAVAARRFERMDVDHNGIIEPQERAAWRATHRGARAAGAGGYQEGPQGGEAEPPAYER